MKKIILYYILIHVYILFSCKKDFLNSIHDKSLIVPETLDDYQAILNNDVIMNGANIHAGCPTPLLGAIATDDFYLPNELYNNLSESNLKIYKWEQDEYYDYETISNWSRPFVPILNANIVLNGLKDINRNESNKYQWDLIKGSALFFRAHSYFHLSQLFAPDYNKELLNDLPGLPLRKEPDISVKLKISSLKETYEFIINDLENSILLLPDFSSYKTQPSKLTSYSLLARIYLIMEEYEKANFMANQALKIYSDLLDYNDLNLNITHPIPQLNNEVIFVSNMVRNYWMESHSIVNPELYNMYEENDLRKHAYFNASGNYRGSYDGNVGLFGGITTSEILLIRSETYARMGKRDESIADLNLLLRHRYVKMEFKEIDFISVEALLKFIIDQRRMELVNRGLAWSDLRRLNRDDRFKRTMKRIVNNRTYEILPGSHDYVFKIPIESQ